MPQDHGTLLAALQDTMLTQGDTILVGPGTYTGPGNRDLSFNGKNLVMRSTHGAEMTIIDLQATLENNHRGFLFANGQFGTVTREAVLDGFTILNGLMGTPLGPDKTLDPHEWPGAAAGGRSRERVQHDLSGAGIMIRNGASPTIRNTIIRDCRSEYTGGGVGVEFFSDPLFENVVVQGCTAGIFGGGISVETLATGTFVDCIITGNVSPIAGGIAVSADVVLQGCVVADNNAERGGGLDVVFGSSLQAERSIIWNNCAVDSGGQVFVDPALVTPVTFSCCAIDTTGVRDLGGVAAYLADNVYVAPQFCEPAGCFAAPTTAGHYTLRQGSPCLPQNNTCGELIGASATTCSTPVERRSLSQVKSLFR